MMLDGWLKKTLKAVCIERVLRDLQSLESFSSGGPGITRLAYSLEEQLAREWIVGQLKAIGLSPEVDAVGNVVAVAEGEVAGPPVLTGSHLDSVPNGGRYDGALGVVGALEALRAIGESGVRTRLPVGILITAAEESSRFGVGCLGSRLLAGKLFPERLTSLKDSNGLTVVDALETCNLDARGLAQVSRSPGWCFAFIELHIDQGSSLQGAGVPVGNVTTIVVPSKIRVVFTGEASHAGATPWNQRRDALLGANDFIREVAWWNEEYQSDSTVATVGTLHVEPGAVNVVPGRVTLGLDFRPTSPKRREEFLQRLHGCVRKIATSRGLDGEVDILVTSDPVQCAPHLVDAVQLTADDFGIECLKLPSMAGHDAAQMAALTDVAMILVRNPAGISHSPLESAEASDIALGCQILLGVLLRVAGIALNRRGEGD